MDKRLYHKLYMKKYRQKLIKDKKCIMCLGKLENNYRKRCDTCLDKESKRNKKSWREHRASELERGRAKHYKYKITAFKKISGVDKPECVRCGFKDIRALSVNHKNGDGYNDMAKATGFYIAIALGKRSTTDLEIMCCNCNKIYEYECGRFKLPSGVKQ